MVTNFIFNKKEVNISPKYPGVYLFKDSNKNIIYIGKAVNMKNRLLSYLSKGVFGKTKTLVKNIKYLSCIRTENELEALILESF